ncbi:hypothetical protein, partial [Comamonas kerstersii]
MNGQSTNFSSQARICPKQNIALRDGGISFYAMILKNELTAKILTSWQKNTHTTPSAQPLALRFDFQGRCCINRFQAKLPQTPAVAMPRLPSEDGPVL